MYIVCLRFSMFIYAVHAFVEMTRFFLKLTGVCFLLSERFVNEQNLYTQFHAL